MCACMYIHFLLPITTNFVKSLSGFENSNIVDATDDLLAGSEQNRMQIAQNLKTDKLE